MYDGERLSPTETPAEVCCLIPPIILSSNAHSPRGIQRSMEDGDVIDALLQQASIHLISLCLRSSSHMFRSEVAHAFAHDLSISDREPCRLTIDSVFFSLSRVVPINRSIYTQDNFVHESATSGKSVTRLRQ